MRALLLLLLSLMTVYTFEPSCSLNQGIETNSATNSTKWALLVAGSNGYYNYRHQADICHAYQILHENGYPDSNIIVMMYDDIANNLYNPYPGVIINRPKGSNVYPGVPKDYTGDNVTPQNFLAVMSGNTSAATGRVIPSSPDNDVFIYFADHGGPGLIAFPNDVLYAHQLIDTLGDMYRNNQYRSIVFYMEACESGSMFNWLLPSLTNVFAMTAATPDQSSWGCYCTNNDFGTCLGDTFSVNFLQNLDHFEAIINETIAEQFHIVRNETHKSRVCIYGDLSMQRRNLTHYFVYNYTKSLDSLNGEALATRFTHNNNNGKCYLPKTKYGVDDEVDTRDYKIQFLLNQYSKVNSDHLKNEIIAELRREFFHDALLERIYGRPKAPRNNAPCYPSEHIDTHCLQEKIDEFRKEYGPLTESFFKYIRLLGQECITDF